MIPMILPTRSLLLLTLVVVVVVVAVTMGDHLSL